MQEVVVELLGKQHNLGVGIRGSQGIEGGKGEDEVPQGIGPEHRDLVNTRYAIGSRQHDVPFPGSKSYPTIAATVSACADAPSP
jgi:hypothetical protein